MVLHANLSIVNKRGKLGWCNKDYRMVQSWIYPVLPGLRINLYFTDISGLSWTMRDIISTSHPCSAFSVCMRIIFYSRHGNIGHRMSLSARIIAIQLSLDRSMSNNENSISTGSASPSTSPKRRKYYNCRRKLAVMSWIIKIFIPRQILSFGNLVTLYIICSAIHLHSYMSSIA